MLKFPRNAPGRVGWAALALIAATCWATLWPKFEPALRDGVGTRAARRQTTDDGAVWENGGIFSVSNGGKTAVFGDGGGLGKRGAFERPGGLREVERLRDDFDERLFVGAVEFWEARRFEPGADVALRAVADGWARWGVGNAATARFLETLTTAERAAFERRRREGVKFDFSTERAAAAEASREAAASLAALSLESEKNGENEAEFDGVAAASAFLRSLDGDGDDSGKLENFGNLGEPGGETFLWAAAFDGNPLNSVGTFSAADVVAVSTDPAAFERARRAFSTSAILFFLSTLGGFGGGSLRTAGELFGGTSRQEREFWRRLDAAFRRLGVAASGLKKLLYFARLALFNAFRRFNVEDGVAAKAASARLFASVRLLN